MVRFDAVEIKRLDDKSTGIIIRIRNVEEKWTRHLRL